MAKAPAYPWYPRDFIADVLLLSDLEELLYRRLLDHQWLHGEVPQSVSMIARAGRMSTTKTRKLWSSIEDRFPLEGPTGGRCNRRMEEVRAEQMAHRERRQRAGKKGNESRWKESQCDPNATRIGIAKSSPAFAPAIAIASAVSSAADAALGAAPLDFLDRFPEAHRDDLVGYLRASRNPDAYRRSLLALVDGLTEAPLAAEVVGQAISEMAAAGSQFSINGVRAFSAKITQRNIPAGTKESPGERVLRMAAEQDARATA